jgi:hypothetical protein
MMKRLSIITSTIFVALSATTWADTAEKNKLLAELTGHAQKMQLDATHLSQSLTSKNVSRDTVADMINSIGTDVAGLQKLAGEFEARNFTLNDRQKKEWDIVKTKISVLSSLYDIKKELAEAENLGKNRSSLRVHADNVAKRAVLLQEKLNLLKN